MASAREGLQSLQAGGPRGALGRKGKLKIGGPVVSGSAPTRERSDFLCKRRSERNDKSMFE